MKTAIVTGITGQDGAYLASLLIEKGYRVIGTYRRASSQNHWRMREVGLEGHPSLILECFEIDDLGNAIRLLSKYEPEEFYNLAALSFVASSFDAPLTTANITGQAVCTILEAIRIVNPKIRFYQASSSELYGKVVEVPQSETTPFYPRSPYAVAKQYAHWITINYREAYDIFGVCGILFNHESPLRGREFVTRKVTHGVARIALGDKQPIELGNMDARRDWGFAKEYVEGMWRMMQHDVPDTFVLATGQTQTVRELVNAAFRAVNVTVDWSGSGVNEIGRHAGTGDVLVTVNPRYFRPAEVELLIGDATRANETLGWQPQTSFDSLIRMMVEADLERIPAKLDF